MSSLFMINYISFTVIFYQLLTLGSSTNRPVIGILAQEFNNYKNSSLITASYVKAVESSGARVVPIFIGKSRYYYTRLLSQLNGVVFPGGAVDFHAKGGYGEAGRYIFEEAIYLNNRGIHFPIFGICLGMQLLVTLSNKNRDLLSDCSGTINVALNLNFKPEYRNSSLYGNASRDDLLALITKNITVNNHLYCLTEKNLTLFKLNKFWKVLSTNNDAEGKEFISSMESIYYPFVGVQFHPEKVTFEWNERLDLPHSQIAIRANRLFYDWLNYHSRMNNNSFNSTNIENEYVIYNYTPLFTGKSNTSFSEQQYHFK